jgi:ABC-2 type transport system ATP-binding protein
MYTAAWMSQDLMADLAGDRSVLLSTHIVEDISQTCRNLAIMQNGRVIFHGTTVDLIAETRGKVWMITTDGVKPQGNFTFVSTMNMRASVQYRVVGELSPRAGALEIVPSLEDGYVWLMREQRQPASSLA